MLLFFSQRKDENEIYHQKEMFRKAGAKLAELLVTEKINTVQIMNFSQPEFFAPFIEGIILAGYKFSKYKKEKEEIH